MRTKTAVKLAMLGVVTTFLTAAQSRLDSFDQRVLASHNRERAGVGVPPLKWNAGLAERAQAWADHLAATGRFEHSPTRRGEEPEGENIWGGTSGAYAPEAMVGMWIEEKADFVPGVFPRNSRTGRIGDVSHYTQVIWRDTDEVGCGLARRGNDEILVCRYSDPGNIIGQPVHGALPSA